MEVRTTYEPYEEPKEWTSDHGQLSWKAYGEIVVTCSEHGEVIRHLATHQFHAEYPEHHGNADLARRNHLHFEHGIWMAL